MFIRQCACVCSRYLTDIHTLDTPFLKVTPGDSPAADSPRYQGVSSQNLDLWDEKTDHGSNRSFDWMITFYTSKYCMSVIIIYFTHFIYFKAA